MPKTVWKYTLEPEITLHMPRGAGVLSVHAQGAEVCLWALVDPNAEAEPRRFVVAGTGHALPDEPLRFLGSAHLHDGALVFHVFERGPAETRGRRGAKDKVPARSGRMVPLQRVSGRDPKEDYVLAFALYLTTNACMEFGAAVAVADMHPVSDTPEADAEAWLKAREARTAGVSA